MAQAIAHGAELADGAVQLGALVQQHPPIDARLPVGREHRRDLVQRKTGGPAQRDQREPVQDAGVEHAPQPVPTDGADQAFFLVIP